MGVEIPMVFGKDGTEYLWLGVVDYGKDFGFLVPFPRLHGCRHRSNVVSVAVLLSLVEAGRLVCRTP